VSAIRTNIVANYAGSAWASLMSVLFVPVYIKFLGIESYGLIGVFGTLFSLFGVLDMGLSATMTREMARLSTLDPSGQEARGLARTLELIYWVTAVLLGVIVASLAGPVADYWVKPDRLDQNTVKQALTITGGIVALRWPGALYSGGLRGLDRQPLLNLISSVIATIRGLGAVAVLWLISPTIQAFFSFQILISAIETSCLAMALWRSLPSRGTIAGFALKHLKRVWRFSAGMTGISVVVLLLTQTDKIILSKMLSLELFGYYTLAWTVSAFLLQTVGPIDSAVYPTLTRLVSKKDEKRLKEIYHTSCQMEVAFLVPAALVLILFGDIVLMVWSGNEQIVKNSGPIMSVLALGTCLNGFMHIPYLTQLAYGWTSLVFWQNVASVIVLVPMLVVLTRAYGGIGAAYVWIILNAAYVLIAIQIMHRRILRTEKWIWYLYDVGLPTAAALVVAVIGRILMPSDLPLLLQAMYVVAISGLCFVAAILMMPSLRGKLLETWRVLFQDST
jgi:O-antigen/teichoic acid export membrane protein